MYGEMLSRPRKPQSGGPPLVDCPLNPQLAGNVQAAKQCFGALGDVGSENSVFESFPGKGNEAILTAYDLCIEGGMRDVTSLLCNNTQHSVVLALYSAEVSNE